tara:strand:+ start:191 stop:529 length:339 start_codon:yes stop_codon:yes gene_type:complete
VSNQEKFAASIREAGVSIQSAESELARCEAEEKRTFAKLQFSAEFEQGCKTAAAQTRYADSTDDMFEARVSRGAAKGSLAAAKANLLAAEVAFKAWQSDQALLREEKRVYGA